MKTMNELRSAFGMNEVHHPQLLIRGIAVTLLGTFGIAAVMAWMPTSTDVEGVVFSFGKLLAPMARTIGTEAQTPSEHTSSDAHNRAKCAKCGVVESMREIGQINDEIAPGATGSSAPGDGLIEIPEKPAKRYEITVRMKDGSRRVMMDTPPANWRPGERVIFIEGISHSND